MAQGREVVITSDGKPKARLVPMERKRSGAHSQGTREHLQDHAEMAGGPTAEEIVREDRDGRGW